MSAHCHTLSCQNATRRLANDPRWRRALWIALLVNAAMFGVEAGAGWRAESAALLADAIDFAGDAVNYGLSLAVLGLPAVWASRVAWLKGWMMGLYGLGVLAYAGRLAWVGSAPQPTTMGLIGVLALVANVAVAVLLYRYRSGDANARSVWLCSRNDAIGNVLVVLAALGVFGTGTAWPDLIVAAVMAGLGVSAAWRVIAQARQELKGHAPTA
ncbi:MAG: cation transporter [Caldimonas sp.]|uniref:cation transporter n=1 Tax=Caldimonas sp. TaxID=2838790 RepID=UPI00391C6688